MKLFSPVLVKKGEWRADAEEDMKRKWLIVGILGFLQLLVCAGIIAVVWISGQSLGKARFFYVADTHVVQTVEETFAVDGPATLDVSASSDVNVIVGAGDDVEVTATLDLWGEDEEDARQQLDVQMYQEEGRVVVSIERQPRIYALAVYAKGPHVTLDIRVPAGTRLELETSFGDVEVGGDAGSMELRAIDIQSGSGDIMVTGVGDAQDVKIETLAGDITLQGIESDDLVVRSSSGEISLVEMDISGAVKVRSMPGDVNIWQMSAERLVVGTGAGEFTAADLEVMGGIEIDTSSGDATLREIEAESLFVHTSAGGIRVETGVLAGDLDLESTSGDITVKDVRAAFYKLVTSSGSATLDGCSGPLYFRTSPGDVEIRHCSDAQLDIETSSGEVNFSGSLAAEGDHRVKSSVGDVRIELPVKAAFDLDVQTAHGDIDIAPDFSVVMTSFDEQAIEGQVNGGGPLLQVYTRSGSVTLLSGAE